MDLLHILRNQRIAKVTALSALAVLISACTQTNPAVIRSATPSDNQVVYQDDSNDVYVTPPATISSSNSAAPMAQSSSSTTVSNNNVVTTTTQQRIVYNRDYTEIPKGGYKGDYYTVKRGDTLFYIAWVTGNDFRSLALKNNIKEPYDLQVGQVLNVSGEPTTVVVTEQTASINKPAATQPTQATAPATSTSSSQTSTPIFSKANSSTQNGTQTTATVDKIVWQWPARGRLIERYSNATKGIDISGALGDKIVAAAAGKVVYAGNSLPGYGNLIIIKHNDDYLTAYAHNQTILVKEQQNVRAGQQIATMGNTGTSSVRLHFEIRYKAKSVDPLKYLPSN